MDGFETKKLRNSSLAQQNIYIKSITIVIVKIINFLQNLRAPLLFENCKKKRLLKIKKFVFKNDSHSFITQAWNKVK